MCARFWPNTKNKIFALTVTKNTGQVAQVYSVDLMSLPVLLDSLESLIKFIFYLFVISVFIDKIFPWYHLSVMVAGISYFKYVCLIYLLLTMTDTIYMFLRG